MELSTQDFNYHLPPELIAQKPAEPRDHSRLLTFDSQLGKITSTTHHFYDLPQILKEKPEKFILVRNDSRVIPARIFGQKTSGGRVEVLLTRPLSRHHSSTTGTETWECLTRPGLQPGHQLTFPDSPLTATCLSASGYTRQLEFHFPLLHHHQPMTFHAWLDKIGLTPLPPYIQSHQSESELRQLYQTIYAQTPGSVAAPTAGLHFTPQLDQKLQAAGIEIATVTLHVGLGTFLPVKTATVTDHQMHSEEFTLSSATATQLNQAKAQGKHILAVGTTTIRVLESCALPNPNLPPSSLTNPISTSSLPSSTSPTPTQTFASPPPFLLQPQTGSTDIFIYPPYRFKFVDHLLTNFHLPESTLLMLISALTSAPNTPHPFTTFASSPIGQAYQTAIQNHFHFFSFGDALLIY